MTNDQLELAKRLVATKGWHWIDGMKDDKGRRVTTNGPFDVLAIDSCGNRMCVDGEVLPDIGDIVTAGALPSLVRAAWGRHDLSVVFWWQADDWVLVRGAGEFVQVGSQYIAASTELGAWVRALECAK